MLYQPKIAVIETTASCNMLCIHCGSACSERLPSAEELNADEQCDLLEQLADLGVVTNMLSGGEPTLKSGLEKILARSQQLGMNFGIITNGYQLSDEIFELFNRYRPLVIGISLDGLSKTHNLIRGKKDGWLEALNTMRQLKEMGQEVCVITTLSKLNIGELRAMFELLTLIGVASWQIQLAMPFGRMANRQDLLISEEEFCQACDWVSYFRRHSDKLNVEAADCFGVARHGVIRNGDWAGCTAGIQSLGIDAFGNVMPCLSLRAELSCGNIRQKSLKEIWETSPGFNFNRQFIALKAADGACGRCNYLNNCRGGCASQSQAYYGKYHSSPFCFHRSRQ